MRELQIGDQTVRVRATPLALLFYRQEFNADLLGDLITAVKGMSGMVLLKDASSGEGEDVLQSVDLSGFDSILFMRIAWAMAKADAFGKPFSPFVEWLSTLESFDITDPNLLREIIEEAQSGFFRSGARVAPAAKRRRPK